MFTLLEQEPLFASGRILNVENNTASSGTCDGIERADEDFTLEPSCHSYLVP